MIFITGGTGLVGSHLLFTLLQENDNIKVRALKRSTSHTEALEKIFYYYSDTPDDMLSRIEWVEGDMTDYYNMEELLDGISEVYHCAGTISFNKSEEDRMLNTNIKGTANLVDAALSNNVKKFCHVSSIAALGKTKDNTEITEETYWMPSRKKSGYSKSKFFSEMEVWRGIEEGLDAVIVNPSIILGPGSWDNGSPRFFKTVWEGMKYYTKGITGFVDVRDVSKAMLLLMNDLNFENVKNNRYILNAGNISYQELFNKIADSMQKPRPEYFASDLLLSIAWKAALIAKVFTRKPPFITKNAVAGINRDSHYDGSKICRSIDFGYRALDSSIREISTFFISDIKQ